MDLVYQLLLMEGNIAQTDVIAQSKTQETSCHTTKSANSEAEPTNTTFSASSN